MKIYPFIDSFYRKATVKDGYNTRLLKLYHAFKEAEHVVIGAGAGFSAAAGLEYGGKRFTDNFQDFIARYNMTDMYTSSFYPFQTEEERWAYWARHILINRYDVPATDLYRLLFNAVKGKDYFVITTNVDGQFEKSGFDKERIFAEISARGLPVSREQLETMLSAADGKDTASIMAVAENISAIQRSIESQLAAPDASVELLQTYTGIYMMCNKVYVYALQQALQQIDSRYLDRLGKIRKEAAQLQEHARSLLSGAEETDRKILEVNIAANQRTLDAVDLYNQYLSRQKKHLQQLLQRAEKSFKVAVNTYRTVKTSSDLLGMMHTSEADFSRIFAFQPPDLSLLYDARLRQEFDDITSRLRAAE